MADDHARREEAQRRILALEDALQQLQRSLEEMTVTIGKLESDVRYLMHWSH